MSNYKDLLHLLININSFSEMENFMNGLLTPKEKEELVRRLDIVKMLKKGTSQHEIAQKLRVGVATVTRGSRELQRGNFINI